jgi:sRNA-binding carbon storage regulator CsrA
MGRLTRLVLSRSIGQGFQVRVGPYITTVYVLREIGRGSNYVRCVIEAPEEVRVTRAESHEYVAGEPAERAAQAAPLTLHARKDSRGPHPRKLRIGPR